MPSGFIFAFVTSVAPSAAKMLIERDAKTSGGGVGVASPIRSTGRKGPIVTCPVSVPVDWAGGLVCVVLGAGAREGDAIGVEGVVARVGDAIGVEEGGEVFVAHAARSRAERHKLRD